MRCKGEGLGGGSAIPAIFALKSEQGVLCCGWHVVM